eukprot:3996234-Pyramimonas_sp.AAC.1
MRDLTATADVKKCQIPTTRCDRGQTRVRYPSTTVGVENLEGRAGLSEAGETAIGDPNTRVAVYGMQLSARCGGFYCSVADTQSTYI